MKKYVIFFSPNSSFLRMNQGFVFCNILDLDTLDIFRTVVLHK